MNKDGLSYLYDTHAPRYSEWIAAAGWQAPRYVRSFLGPLLAPGARVLDAACGDGYASLPLRDTCEVHGFDRAREMVRYARARGLDRVRRHDADEALPWADDFFDAAIGLAFLEFVADIRFTLGELARVVRPGGHLLVTTEDRDPALERQRSRHAEVRDGVRRTRHGREEILALADALALTPDFDRRVPGYVSEALGGRFDYHLYLLRVGAK